MAICEANEECQKKWGGRRPKPHTPADAPPPDSGQRPSALGKDTGQPLPRASRAVRNLPTSSASCRCEDAGPSQTSAVLSLRGPIDSKHGLEIGKEADRREEDLPQKRHHPTMPLFFLQAAVPHPQRQYNPLSEFYFRQFLEKINA